MSTALEPTAAPMIDVVVPVRNEERDLPRAVEQLTASLATLPWSWQLTIADNGSTDHTPAIARQLADNYPGVGAVLLPRAGRGYALKQVWRNSAAQILAYTDVDLATDLNALLPLCAPLVSGHSDLAIGTRLTGGARVSRGLKRELISRSYNGLLHAVLNTGFTDAQCGFKAIRADTAAALLPLVVDDEWFFDTELLVIAESAGLRIHEVPVDWTDDDHSSVHLAHTAWDDLCGMRRVGWSLVSHRLPLADVRAVAARDPIRPG